MTPMRKYLIPLALAAAIVGTLAGPVVGGFNEDVDKLLERLPFYKIVKRERHSIEMASPAATPIFTGIYQRMLLIDGEGPRIRLEEPDCESLTISTAIPEDTGRPPMLDLWGQEIDGGYGTFHYNQWAVSMSPEDAMLYCETDWSVEIELLRKMQLKAIE